MLKWKIIFRLKGDHRMKRKQVSNLASMILEALGGSANIVSLSHCMTRLRLDVKNMDVVKVNQLKTLDG